MSSSPLFFEPALHWRKSSRSTPEGSNCVEVAGTGAMIAFRDSTNPTGPALGFTRLEMSTFTGRIKSGELDL